MSNLGPGFYEPNDQLQRFSSPTYKMSSTDRQSIISPEKLRQPGPGAYDHSGNGSPSKSFTIGEKRSNSRGDNIPGPGYYNESYD